MINTTLAAPIEAEGPPIDPVLLEAFHPWSAWRLMGAEILKHGAIVAHRDMYVLSNVPLSVIQGAAETLLAVNILERALVEIGYNGPVSAVCGELVFDFARQHADEFARRFLFDKQTEEDWRPDTGYTIPAECILDFLMEKLGYAQSTDRAA